MTVLVDSARELDDALRAAGFRVVGRLNPVVPPCVLILGCTADPDQGPAAVSWRVLAVPAAQVVDTPAGYAMADLLLATLAAIPSSLGGSWRLSGPDVELVGGGDVWGYTAEIALLSNIVLP